MRYLSDILLLVFINLCRCAATADAHYVWNNTKPYSRLDIEHRYKPVPGSPISKLRKAYNSNFRLSCAIISTEFLISKRDSIAYAVRLIEVLQQRRYHTYLVFPEASRVHTKALLKLAAKLGSKITSSSLSLIPVDSVDLSSVTDLCTDPLLQIHIGPTPTPLIPNVAAHGVYIAQIDSLRSSELVHDERSKKLWLSYDQIWLPSWQLQAEYNQYILPLVDYAHEGPRRMLWPVINSVVISSGPQGSKAFVHRASLLLKRGELEGRLRSNFHRINNVNSPYIKPNSPVRYAAAIYEGRTHYALEGICQNVMANMAPAGGWDLHVFHSGGNSAFVHNAFRAAEGVTLHLVNNSEQSINKYNDLLIGIPFWSILAQYERVLIFQVDSFFLQPLVLSHLSYDYVGSPWCLRSNRPAMKQYRQGNIRADSSLISVGNGGLSLRNPASMLRCIKEFAPSFGLTSEYPEDMFFVQCMTALNMSISPPSEALHFGLEQPCGKDLRAQIVSRDIDISAVHAAWYTLNKMEFEQLLVNYGM